MHFINCGCSEYNMTIQLNFAITKYRVISGDKEILRMDKQQ